MKSTRASQVLAVSMAVGSLCLVTGASAGASQPAPVRHGTVQVEARAAKTAKVAFSASYKGTMSLLWASSSVSVTALTGTGVATKLGTTTLKGTGSSAPSSTCDPFGGKGTITSAKGTLILSVVSSSKQSACASGSAAPTSVSVTGVATVTNGTGVYAGAKGSLTIKGSFSIQSTTAGSSESDAFTATLKGTLTVKG